MTTPIIYPYKIGSRSARALRAAFTPYKPRCRLVFPDRRFRLHPAHLIINWGSGSAPVTWQLPPPSRLLNKPEAVSIAANKLHTYDKLYRDSTLNAFVPRFTRDRTVAANWLRNGNDLYIRRQLSGCAGAGIDLADADPDSPYYRDPDSLPQAPLYVQRVPNRNEYRVHVFQGRVIDYSRKARTYAREDINWRIRTHDNGFVYARGGVELPNGMADVALNTIRVLGLDFAAIDFLSHPEHGFKIGEVNTAPGLEGSTVQHYTACIRRLLR